jgi:hypothetical protein
LAARRTSKNRSRKTPAKKRRANSSSKSAKSAESAELQRLEHLLGEDFSTLSEARAAFATETGAAPGKSSYTVKELSHKRHNKIQGFIADLEEHEADVDALKKPTDFWAAEINGYNTYSLFANTHLLTQKLLSYKGLQEESPKLINQIKIIKVRGVDAGKYHAAKKAQVKESWRKAKEKRKLDRSRQRKQARDLARATKQLKAERKLTAKLQRELDKLKKKQR